jgi:hypothetical protein
MLLFFFFALSRYLERSGPARVLPEALVRITKSHRLSASWDRGYIVCRIARSSAVITFWYPYVELHVAVQ